MKYLRMTAIGLFAMAIGLFVLSEVQERMDEDPHSPVITCDTDEIEIPVDYTREQLMEGVHAEDQEDGDLTDEIITGQFSQFIDDGVSELSYVVFDSANQPAVCERKVRFTDYEPPKFSLTGPLVFNAGDVNNAANMIRVQDVLDGDITELLLNKNDDISYQIPGTYSIEVEVTNSFGDMQSAVLPVHVTNAQTRLLGNPSPLIYVEKGGSFDAGALAGKLTGDRQAPVNAQEVTVESNVDTSNPGVYEVHYACPQGETWTTVIVR